MKPLVKIRIGVIVFFVALYALIYYYLDVDKHNRIDHFLTQKLESLQSNYQVSTSRFHLASDTLFNAVIDQPDVKEIFYQAKHARDDLEMQKQLREKLYNRLRPFYDQMRDNGIKIMLFTFEDNKVFLRVHKPNKFLDDITNVRYGVVLVNQDKKLRRGFEQGKISHAFRNIFPIYHNGEYLGNVDISFSSENLQDNLVALHKVDTHFILKKSLFDVKIWQSQRQVKYINSIEHEDYFFAVTPQQQENMFSAFKLDLMKALRYDIDRHIADGKPFVLYEKVEDTVGLVSFYPVVNIKDAERVAYVVSYEESPYLEAVIRDFFLVNMTIIVGFILLMIVICNNIRQRFFLQEEVDAKTRDLKQLNDNLQDEVELQLKELRTKDNLLIEQSRMASMGEMIANIAHQWRQPLNALGLILQKLEISSKRDLLDEKMMSESVEKGMTLIHRMSSTIDDFRHFLEPSDNHQPFKLKKSVEMSLSLLEGMFEASGIEVKEIVDPDIVIDGCPNELSQVIVNILNNAKDAIHDNKVEHGWIKIEVKGKNDKAILSIEDNAGGIPESIINHIFDPYFSTKDEGKGTGIGLFMSKRIITEKMDGTIAVANSQFGAVFTITFPLSN